MTGTNKTVSTISSTNNSMIDGILGSHKWGSAITYAFPTSSTPYGPKYQTGKLGGQSIAPETESFTAVDASVQKAAKFALEGNGVGIAFSIEGFTKLDISAGAETTSHIRYGNANMTAAAGGALGGYTTQPANGMRAGDVWMNSAHSSGAKAGNAQWYNVLHETGHAVGLKHPFSADYGKPVLPKAYDSMEYTVMSYKAYAGAAHNLGNGQWGYAQTYMRSDIAALQSMYGVDFNVNAGNTTYTWTPTNGKTLINGAVAIDPGANVIFLTIWDGGGNDTYDLSAYKTRLAIDLTPGGYSWFGGAQNAVLDKNAAITAAGTVYNAFQHKSDIRSLIENVKGGANHDVIKGNAERNQLLGGAGNDTIMGEAGNDTLNGGDGNDFLHGGVGSDSLIGGLGADVADYTKAAAKVVVNLSTSRGTLGDALGDTYNGIENVVGSKFNDEIFGNNNPNGLYGGAGNDKIHGLAGDDYLYGQGGADKFYFGAGKTGKDRILDFNTREDVIDFQSHDQFDDYAEVVAAMSETRSGVTITAADGDTIFLANLKIAQLSADDFVF